MYGAESRKVAEAEFPVVLSRGIVGSIILPATVCDSTHRVFSSREAHLTLGVQRFS